MSLSPKGHHSVHKAPLTDHMQRFHPFTPASTLGGFLYVQSSAFEKKLDFNLRRLCHTEGHLAASQAGRRFAASKVCCVACACQEMTHQDVVFRMIQIHV